MASHRISDSHKKEKGFYRAGATRCYSMKGIQKSSSRGRASAYKGGIARRFRLLLATFKGCDLSIVRAFVVGSLPPLIASSLLATLASHCCCDKLPQTWWVKTTHMYFLCVSQRFISTTPEKLHSPHPKVPKSLNHYSFKSKISSKSH